MADLNWWRRPVFGSPPSDPGAKERGSRDAEEEAGSAVPVPVPEGSPTEGTSRSVDWGTGAGTGTATAAPPTVQNRAATAEPNTWWQDAARQGTTYDLFGTPPPTVGPQSADMTRFSEAPGERRERADLPPTLMQQALQAVLDPGRIERGLRRMEQEQAGMDAATTKAIALATTRNEMRKDFEKAQEDALKAYHEALGEKRPQIPDLRKPPEVPDVKIRPWLDPEGKDALSMIAQTLGMLATGIGGLVIGAPKTAMKLFRDAAEDWRQGEVDRAASNWKAFEGEMVRMKAENEQALQVYEMKDKEYGANQLAKRAAVIVEFERQKNFDAATAAAMVPMELAIQGHHQALEGISKIMDAQAKWGKVVTDYELKKTEIPASIGGKVGKYQATLKLLESEQDPAERTSLQRRAEVLKDAIAQEQKLLMDRYEALGGISVAKEQIPKLQQSLGQLDGFLADTTRFAQALDRFSKAGMLPSTPTPFSQWGTWFTRMFSAKMKDPQVQEDYQTILTHVPMLMGTYERTIENLIGMRHRDFFAIPHDPSLVTTAQLRSMIKMFKSGADRARDRYEERIKTLGEQLPRVMPPSLGGPPLRGGGGGDDGGTDE